MTRDPTGKSSRSTEPLSTLLVPLHASRESRARSGDSRPGPSAPARLWGGG